MVNIVSVNGLRIETNKPGVSMINGFVYFGDGSTYDSRTGTFQDNGPGYVKVNGQLLHASPDVVKTVNDEVVTRSFDGFETTALSLETVTATVIVEPCVEATMRVEAKGPKNLIDTVSVRPKGNTLSVRESQPSGNSYTGIMSGVSQSIVVGRGVSIVGSGNVYVSGVSGGKGDDVLTIRIYVPVGSVIAVDLSVAGRVRIGKVDGPIDIDISGSGNVSAESACGNVSVQLSGSGDVTVRDGVINDLNVRISGSGDVRVGGTVREAKLKISGSGDIRVARVLREPSRKVSGSGTIKVKRVG